MPTYVYESIPSNGGEPERFEVTQGMNDAPLQAHPDTGEPVRRIITGGLGIKTKPLRRSTVVNKSLAAATPCGCAKGAMAAMATAKHTPVRRPAQACSHGHHHKHEH